MTDRGFLIRGRELRLALDELIGLLQDEEPGRYISRESLARNLLFRAIESEKTRLRRTPKQRLMW